MGFTPEHVFAGHDHWEIIQQSQLKQRRARPAAAGRGSQRQSGATAMQLAYKAHRARDGSNPELHLPEDAILAPAEFLELWIWAVSKKMTQDVAAFAAIENEAQLGLGHFASERLEKQTPSLAM